MSARVITDASTSIVPGSSMLTSHQAAVEPSHMSRTEEVSRCQQPSPHLYHKARTLLGFTDHPCLQPASCNLQPGSFTQLLQASDDCLQMPSPELDQQQGQHQAENHHRPRKGLKPYAVAAPSMLKKIKERMQQCGDARHSPQQLASQQHNRKQALQNTALLPTLSQRIPAVLPAEEKHVTQPSREVASGIRNLQQQLWPKASTSTTLEAPCHKSQALHQQSFVNSIADGTLEEALQRLDISNIVFKGIPISGRPVAAGPHTPAAPTSWPPHQTHQQHSQSPCTRCGSYATWPHSQQAQEQQTQGTSTIQGRLSKPENLSYEHAAPSGLPISHQQSQADLALPLHTAQPCLQATDCRTGSTALKEASVTAISASQAFTQGHTDSTVPGQMTAAGVADPLLQPTAQPCSHNPSVCALQSSSQQNQLSRALQSVSEADGHQGTKSVAANDIVRSDLLNGRPASTGLSHQTDTPELQAGGSTTVQDRLMLIAARCTASLPTVPVIMIPVSTAPAQTLSMLVEEPAACCSANPVYGDTDDEDSDQATQSTEQTDLESIIGRASGVLASLTAAAAQMSGANKLAGLCSTAPVHSQAQQLCHNVSAAFQQTPLMAGHTDSWDNDPQIMTIPNAELHLDDQTSFDTAREPTELLHRTETSSTLRKRPDWCNTMVSREGEASNRSGLLEQRHFKLTPQLAERRSLHSGDLARYTGEGGQPLIDIAEDLPDCLLQPCTASDVLEVAALLSGQAKFSLNNLYAICVDWAEQARAEPELGLPAWPGLKAVVRLISPDKSLAKEAIFTVLTQSKHFVTCGHSDEGLQQWSLRVVNSRKRGKARVSTANGEVRTAADEKISQPQAQATKQPAEVKHKVNVKQIQMSKAASASLSQHYQLAIAQKRARQASSKPTVAHSSPHHVLSPSNRDSGRSAKEGSKGVAGVLSASVHAKVTRVMKSVLRGNTSSPPTARFPSEEMSEAAAMSEAQSLETDDVEISSLPESCSEFSAADKSLQQQALRVKASAVAVLHGIDWATGRADSIRDSMACEFSGQSSSATCSNPHRTPEPDDDCELTSQLIQAGNNSTATDSQSLRVVTSNPHNERHQQCAALSAKLPFTRAAQQNKAP